MTKASTRLYTTAEVARLIDADDITPDDVLYWFHRGITTATVRPRKRHRYVFPLAEIRKLNAFLRWRKKHSGNSNDYDQ